MSNGDARWTARAWIFASAVNWMALLSLVSAEEWDRTYGTACWPANSSFTDPECRCRGGLPRHSEFDSRPTIKVSVGGWQGAATDAFLLKIAIEQELGYPTELLPDTWVPEGVDPEDNDLLGDALHKVFFAMSRGELHIYPEVLRCAAVTSSNHE